MVAYNPHIFTMSKVIPIQYKYQNISIYLKTIYVNIYIYIVFK